MTTDPPYFYQPPETVSRVRLTHAYYVALGYMMDETYALHWRPRPSPSTIQDLGLQHYPVGFRSFVFLPTEWVVVPETPIPLRVPVLMEHVEGGCGVGPGIAILQSIVDILDNDIVLAEILHLMPRSVERLCIRVAHILRASYSRHVRTALYMVELETSLVHGRAGDGEREIGREEERERGRKAVFSWVRAQGSQREYRQHCRRDFAGTPCRAKVYRVVFGKIHHRAWKTPAERMLKSRAYIACIPTLRPKSCQTFNANLQRIALNVQKRDYYELKAVSTMEDSCVVNVVKKVRTPEIALWSW
ncbi:hypothetical protein LXA43DRAFT_1067167 [Ganoderma leucocontextum]|nr:hypothetical protein LXA43DRAFT_1067167 [Ganoderma leucocontextum]